MAKKPAKKPKKAKKKGSERRRFPRKPTKIKVRLEAEGSRGTSFEAILPTRDVSIGGVFLESQFFIKIGTRLNVFFELPDLEEPVHVKGFVAREERQGNRRTGERSGFAIEFSEYIGFAKLTLATYFLAPEISSFVTKYRRSRRQSSLRTDQERMVDVIVAWEIHQFDQGRGRIIT